MYVKTNQINDENHLKNLYAHMDRSGERYDAVRASIQVEILKPLTESYTKNMNHCVLKFDNFAMANRIGNYILLNLGSPCYAMTVVGGVYPDGSNMEPSIHIIFNGDYKSALNKIVKQL